MDEIEKNILVNELFDIYGELLSKTQQKMIKLYYNMDLSLTEIAEQENVSRNAVHDALKKGIESLSFFEDKLHLLSKKNNLHKKLSLLEKEISKENYKRVLNIFKEDE